HRFLTTTLLSLLIAVAVLAFSGPARAQSFPVSCDNTGALECADFGVKLALCEAAKGGEVIFPAGTFLLNAGYTVNGACIVSGQGYQTFFGDGTTSALGTIGTYLKQTTTANTMLTIA